MPSIPSVAETANAAERERCQGEVHRPLLPDLHVVIVASRRAVLDPP
jgi:hypothetical protein